MLGIEPRSAACKAYCSGLRTLQGRIHFWRISEKESKNFTACSRNKFMKGLVVLLVEEWVASRSEKGSKHRSDMESPGNHRKINTDLHPWLCRISHIHGSQKHIWQPLQLSAMSRPPINLLKLRERRGGNGRWEKSSVSEPKSLNSIKTFLCVVLGHTQCAQGLSSMITPCDHRGHRWSLGDWIQINSCKAKALATWLTLHHASKVLLNQKWINLSWKAEYNLLSKVS